MGKTMFTFSHFDKKEWFEFGVLIGLMSVFAFAGYLVSKEIIGNSLWSILISPYSAGIGMIIHLVLEAKVFYKNYSF